MTNFSRTAANLFAAITKIDNSYYPETLHRMYIVNAGPGFKKMLWPAAQKFFDAKTTSKIHVLEPKSLHKLLEVIDPSQLPDFLGGSCTCSAEGGCLKSNKGPWNDPEVMKHVNIEKATYLRQIIRVPTEQKNSCVTQSQKVAESDLDCIELPLTESSSSAPVHDEARVSDANGYYSCDDSSTLHEKGHCKDRLLTTCPSEAAPYLLGQHFCRFNIAEEKLGKGKVICAARALTLFVAKLIALLHQLPFKHWRRQNKNIHPSSSVEGNVRGSDSKAEGKASKPKEEDKIAPCMERLQRLERLVVELSNKPPQIPKEKEQVLVESLDRIKSVEFDLEKTKRVLHSAVVKQLEIAHLLEGLREESQFRRRRLFC